MKDEEVKDLMEQVNGIFLELGDKKLGALFQRSVQDLCSYRDQMPSEVVYSAVENLLELMNWLMHYQNETRARLQALETVLGITYRDQRGEYLFPRSNLSPSDLRLVGSDGRNGEYDQNLPTQIHMLERRIAELEERYNP